MKRLSYLFILILVLSGCGSSKKQMQRGNYDAAIDKSVKKLRKDPGSEDDIMVLERSYQIANEQDLERIKFLKMDGNPNTWEEILNYYVRLKNRQTLVRTVLPLQLNNRTINYDYIDYDSEIIEAKHKAAEYFFAHGQKLMESNTKEAYRQAHYEFLKVKQYWGDYENIDQLIAETKYNGMSQVLVTVENSTQFNLSQEFEDDLLAINHQNLNSEWVEYHTRHLDENIEYDYLVYINLKNISVSPESIKDTDRIIKREVEDGFEYVLDQNGNVMKDSLGNDIKLKKYKTLTCTVIESLQQKAVRIDGDVEIFQTNPQNLLKKDPIGAETLFEHLSARAIGDLGALSAETMELVEIEPLPFPPDFDMILQCSETLKLAIRDILRRNRRYIN
ncbi:MAG: hypothetical protein JSV24_04660 [Bacteroidales bacterium]|nr:MAG: hypothetical protein JSV24_04660 [Bacteroidales bacterium]